MTANPAHLQALAHICSSFGGQLALVSEAEFIQLFHKERSRRQGGYKDPKPENVPELSEAPFTSGHGIWWSRKIIYAVHGLAGVGPIIHEMGHVFAAVHPPNHECEACVEWNWFGWEGAVARKIGAFRTWSRQNTDYVIEENGDSWGKLLPARRRTIVLNCLKIAQKLGTLDENGNPRNVR